MIEGILFDMDGVLIDSEPVILHAAMTYFETIGIKTQPEDYIPFIGAGDRKFLCGVAEKYGKKLNFEEARDALFALYAEYANDRGPMDGVHRFIKNARKSGMKLALATSAARAKAEINLKAIGLEDSDFDCMVTGESIKRNKPNPDIYQLAALSMGLPPQECLVVEDAINGIKAGKSAGSSVCALTTTFTIPEIEEAGADYIFTSLDAFEDFSTKEEFDAILHASIGSDDRTVYGANKILKAPKAIMGDEALLKIAFDQALEARKNAYSPYSKYQVGAAVISSATNRVYSGCNVENSSYGATICAERNAILNAITSEGTIGIAALVVVSEDAPPAPPCAQCLQVLAEFSRPDTVVHLVDVAFAEGRGGTHTQYLFKDLLPHPFIFPSMRQ